VNAVVDAILTNAGVALQILEEVFANISSTKGTAVPGQLHISMDALEFLAGFLP
jgi:hypothetical protein